MSQVFKEAVVVGAGAMGQGIAQVLAQSGVSVKLYDTRAEALTAAQASLAKIMNRLVDKGRVTPEDAAATLGRVKSIDNLKDAAAADLVIEAIVESLEAKQSVFKILANVVREDCVLASNTSSLSLAAISSGIPHPERILGLHFFNPAPLMPLVEIVPSIATDPALVARCREQALAWGKSPVVAKDTPGFIVNRVARPFYAEAMNIYEEGLADIPTIDWAMREIGGFRMGPFELTDLIGHDVNYVVTETVWTQFYYDPRFRPNLCQKRLVEAGWLGRKTGRGFYDYGNHAEHAEPSQDPVLGQRIVDRIIALLINEACDAVYRQICSPEDLETAMQRGVNYPKGLLAWGAEIGWTTVLDRLEQLQSRTGDIRYRPCPYLRDLASGDKTLDL